MPNTNAKVVFIKNIHTIPPEAQIIAESPILFMFCTVNYWILLLLIFTNKQQFCGFSQIKRTRLLH